MIRSNGMERDGDEQPGLFAIPGLDQTDLAPAPKIESPLVRDLRLMVEAYGYNRVAEHLSDLAPAPDMRLAQVDAPPTARRAAEKQDSDPTRFGKGSIKAKILSRCLVVGETDRNEIIEWWITEVEHDAQHGRIESVRRRFDELVQIGYLTETDLTGDVRRVQVTLPGTRAFNNLRSYGKTKPV